MNSLMRGELTSFNELTSAGKSGSFFYYSANGKFILKTMTKEEFTVLLDILPQYYKHLKEHPDSLMCRYYGLHKIVFKKLQGSVTSLYRRAANTRTSTSSS
jgi:1-phosphatidylinositol-4-phosphate 5-kinase